MVFTRNLRRLRSGGLADRSGLPVCARGKVGRRADNRGPLPLYVSVIVIPPADCHLRGTMNDLVAVLDELAVLTGRVLMLAPSEHRKALCSHALQEMADVVEQVLKGEGGRIVQ
jgi:hypothetical protein